MVSFDAGRWIATAGIVAAATCTGSLTATAQPGFMVTGAATSQPMGHYQFCQRFLGECSIRPALQEPEAMTSALMDMLRTVTTSVNETVNAMSDEDLYGTVEFWNFPDGAGDCEDYVLQKQKVLSERGLSRANLLITVVRKPDGEGHAVLTVRTDAGDYILDNLSNDVREWETTGYTFLKRQSSELTGRWVTIEHTHDEPLVGSIGPN